MAFTVLVGAVRGRRKQEAVTPDAQRKAPSTMRSDSRNGVSEPKAMGQRAQQDQIGHTGPAVR